MKTNLNFKKIKTFKTKQDYLRKKAIKSGVNLIAPETIFLSNDTRFGKNVTINPRFSRVEVNNHRTISRRL